MSGIWGVLVWSQLGNALGGGRSRRAVSVLRVCTCPQLDTGLQLGTFGLFVTWCCPRIISVLLFVSSRKGSLRSIWSVWGSYDMI